MWSLPSSSLSLSSLRSWLLTIIGLILSSASSCITSVTAACTSECGQYSDATCINNTCQCSLGWYGSSCSIYISSITPSYMTFRIIFLVLWSVSILVLIRPLIITIIAKIHQWHHHTSLHSVVERMRLFVFDERFLCLLAVFIGDVTLLIHFIDPIGVQGIWSEQSQLTAIILGSSCHVLAGAATVRLFMSLQAPFCKKTRRALWVFDGLVVAFLVLESFALGMTTHWINYGSAYVSLVGAIGHGGLLIVLTLAAYVYSLTLLQSLLRASPSEERKQILTRSLQSLRLATTAGATAVLVLIVLSLVQLAFDPNSWYVYVVGISVLRVVQVAASLLLTYFMGRSVLPDHNHNRVRAEPPSQQRNSHMIQVEVPLSPPPNGTHTTNFAGTSANSSATSSIRLALPLNGTSTPPAGLSARGSGNTNKSPSPRPSPRQMHGPRVIAPVAVTAAAKKPASWNWKQTDRATPSPLPVPIIVVHAPESSTPTTTTTTAVAITPAITPDDTNTHSTKSSAPMTTNDSTAAIATSAIATPTITMHTTMSNATIDTTATATTATTTTIDDDCNNHSGITIGTGALHLKPLPAPIAT